MNQSKDSPHSENQKAARDRLDPQDPERRAIQSPIPTHPPDPAAAGEIEKIVPPPDTPRAPGEPAPVSTGISSGAPFDHVGGAGLGQAPGEAGEHAPGHASEHTPAGQRDQDVKAVDQQDRRDGSEGADRDGA